MQTYTPIRLFLLYFLPGAAIAVFLAILSMANAPGLAPIVLVALGFLAFAVAVERASRHPDQAERRGRFRSIEALLHLRRHRARYAFAFAVTGISFTVVALIALSLAGQSVPVTVNPAAFLQALAILFVVAWILIGEAACSHKAIRRALRGQGTPPSGRRA